MEVIDIGLAKNRLAAGEPVSRWLLLMIIGSV